MTHSNLVFIIVNTASVLAMSSYLSQGSPLPAYGAEVALPEPMEVYDGSPSPTRSSSFDSLNEYTINVFRRLAPLQLDEAEISPAHALRPRTGTQD